MSYTNVREDVEAIIENGGYEIGGVSYELHSVYECINASVTEPDGVFWMLFSDERYDDMYANPFVGVFIKVWSRDKSFGTSADDWAAGVGDLVDALRVRQHALHILHQKFSTPDVVQYVTESEKRDGPFRWVDMFRDPDTGQIRRLDLIDDMFEFIRD